MPRVDFHALLENNNSFTYQDFLCLLWLYIHKLPFFHIYLSCVGKIPLHLLQTLSSIATRLSFFPHGNKDILFSSV